MIEDDEDAATIFRRRRLLSIAFGFIVLERNESFRIASKNEEKLELWNSTSKWNQCLRVIDRFQHCYSTSLQSRRSVRVAVAFHQFFLVARTMRTFKRWCLQQYSLHHHMKSRIVSIYNTLPVDCFDSSGDPLYNNLIDIAMHVHRQRQLSKAKLFIQRLKRRIDCKQLASSKLITKLSPEAKLFLHKLQNLVINSRKSLITLRHCKQHYHHTTRTKYCLYWHQFVFSTRQKRKLTLLCFEHFQERKKKLVLFQFTQRLDNRSYYNRINQESIYHYQEVIQRKYLTRWLGKGTDRTLTAGIGQKADLFHRKYRLRHAEDILSCHRSYSRQRKEQQIYVDSIMKRLRRFFILRRGLHTWQLNHASLYSQRWHNTITAKYNKKVVYQRLIHGRLLQKYLPVVLRRQAALLRRAVYYHFTMSCTKAISTWQASFIQSQRQVDSCIKATWQWKLYRARRAFTRIQQYTLRRMKLRERHRKKLVFLSRNTDEKVLLESFYHWRAVYDRLVTVRRERIRKEFLLGRDNALHVLCEPSALAVSVMTYQRPAPSDNDLLHMAPKPLSITYPKIPDFLKYSTTAAMAQVDSALACSEWRKEHVVDEYLAKAAAGAGVPRGGEGSVRDKENLDFVHMKPRHPSSLATVYRDVDIDVSSEVKKDVSATDTEEKRRVLKEALQFLRGLQAQLSAAE